MCLKNLGNLISVVNITLLLRRCMLESRNTAQGTEHKEGLLLDFMTKSD
jgi:hypothetical protein